MKRDKLMSGYGIRKIKSRCRRILNILAKLWAISDWKGSAKSERDPHETAAFGLLETLYTEVIRVLDGLPQIRREDFELAEVKKQILFPIARYLTRQAPTEARRAADVQFEKPLFVSGAPGIGKTTLLMVLDEALSRLELLGVGSCRGLVISGKVSGYFTYKPILHVTPLSLFGTPTAVLSARDWNNILRHWTFDESTARDSTTALLDFIRRLRGKIVIVDEAELEGYVYFSELLARHGILVVLSSNLSGSQIHLAPDHVRLISLQGSDHRQGDISRVCLPDTPHELFDLFARDSFGKTKVGGVKLSCGTIGRTELVYLKWSDLENQPLMKDDFAHCFIECRAEAVLLDVVPFFTALSPEIIDLTFLGYLSRFVNFVDAIHDCRLPVLIRGTHRSPLDAQTGGSHLLPLLTAYDQRTGGSFGQVAWIEWTRCLSRLRSRESINAQVWPLVISYLRNHGPTLTPRLGSTTMPAR